MLEPILNQGAVNSIHCQMECSIREKQRKEYRCEHQYAVHD